MSGVEAPVAAGLPRDQVDAQAAVAPAPPRPALVRHLVRNLTVARLRIRGRDGVLALAPLEERALDPEQLAGFDFRRLVLDGVVEQDTVVMPPPASASLGAALGLTFWIGGGILAFALAGVDIAWWAWALLLIPPAVPVIALASRRNANGQLSRSVVLAWVRDRVVFGAVVVIGFSVPLAALWATSNLREAIHALDEPGQRAMALVVIAARLIQVVFIAALTLLPALLYFLFDREEQATQSDRFVRQVVRFDDRVTSVADVRGRYGRLLAEVYGTGRSSALRAHRAPVLVATIVIGVGWLIAFANPRLGLPANAGDVQFANYFVPLQTTVVFAFLGGYFYALNSVLRGHIRRDLRPKSYSGITVRIVSVITLAWVLEAAFGPSKVLLVLAFLSGILPDTAFVVLRELVSRRFGGTGASLSALNENDPLTSLEGIDIYDRARLLDEGVTNVEALAHQNVVELMLQTRIPAPQLVDWVDQAILYLHAGSREGAEDVLRETTIERLRAQGIRTATDLERAYEHAAKRGGETAFAALLGGEPPRVRTILDALADDEWMHQIRFWRAATSRPVKTLELDARPA